MTEQTTSITFDDHCRQSVSGLRSALLELYRVVDADPARPQDVSRRYKLNKNLTWKVARIIASEDVYDAVPLIPGPGGLDILLDAMEQAGAPKPALRRVRDAAGEFDRMIELHTGDRSTLELVLDSMGQKRPAEMSRKLAFQGNSGIWGIQAGVRVTTYVVAPNADDASLLDIVMVGGMTRVRRLRPVERWPVFQVRQYQDDGTAGTRGRREPIEPATEDRPGEPWLMRSFCDGAMPEIHLRRQGDTTMYEIGDGPVGLTGEFSCYFGVATVGNVPRYRDGSNTVGELVSSVSAPVEALHFDLFFHESLTEAMPPSTEMIGTLGGTLDGVGSLRLPLLRTFRDLGRGAMADTPLIDRYGEIVSAVFRNRSWDASRFRCYRLVVEHPPMSSRVIARYSLPLPPGA